VHICASNGNNVMSRRVTHRHSLLGHREAAGTYSAVIPYTDLQSSSWGRSGLFDRLVKTWRGWEWVGECCAAREGRIGRRDHPQDVC